MSKSKLTTFGALADERVMTIGDGYRTRRDQLASSGHRILRVADVEDGEVRAQGPDFVDESFGRAIGPKLAKFGDVLLTTKGTVGRVAIITDLIDSVVYSPQLCYFRVEDTAQLVPRYLAFWLKSGAFIAQSSHLQSNTDMAPYLSLRDLRSVQISIPPLAEQQAIAEVLGALDDKIAANTKLARSIEDFIQAKYADSVAHSTKVSIFDVIDIDYGEAFKGEYFSEPGEGRPLIRIRDISSLTPKVWTTEARAREVMVASGDVVVGMDAEFVPSPWFGLPGLLNQRVCRARSVKFGNAFVWQSLIRPLGAIQNEKSATTVIHLNKSDLMRSTIDMPRQAALTEFERAAEPAFEKRVAISTENRSLANIRDTLLPHLMSGKMRVRDAERTVRHVV